jgi:GDPmannose 4,6-dehydratase
MRNAVITGIAGQDGSYLAELLLSKDYRVIGITRRKSVDDGLTNIRHLLNNRRLLLEFGDITDAAFIYRLADEYKPLEWYNLAAQSHVRHSFDTPLETFDTNAKAVLSQLEALRLLSKDTRFYQASTSELFGGLACPGTGYTEESPLHPRSPYAMAKAAAYHAVVNYREAYGMFACNGILFNHSSPRRGMDFATRKITYGVASIKSGRQETLKMGNLTVFRDEGHSKDYVAAMHLILTASRPDDFIVATGRGATIDEMLRYVCELAHLDPDEVYEKDERFMRPSDVPYLLGNPKKIKTTLGWTPTYTWAKLLEEMYEHDLKRLKG